MRTSIVLLLVVLVAVSAAAALRHDDPHAVAHTDPAHACHAHGAEFRRRHSCAVIKHTKSNVCCWSLDNAVHAGLMPIGCCGSAWDKTCEEVVAHACDVHHA